MGGGARKSFKLCWRNIGMVPNLNSRNYLLLRSRNTYFDTGHTSLKTVWLFSNLTRMNLSNLSNIILEQLPANWTNKKNLLRNASSDKAATCLDRKSRTSYRFNITPDHWITKVVLKTIGENFEALFLNLRKDFVEMTLYIPPPPNIYGREK